jgi:hypothetical protein
MRSSSSAALGASNCVLRWDACNNTADAANPAAGLTLAAGSSNGGLTMQVGHARFLISNNHGAVKPLVVRVDNDATEQVQFDFAGLELHSIAQIQDAIDFGTFTATVNASNEAVQIDSGTRKVVRNFDPVCDGNRSMQQIGNDGKIVGVVTRANGALCIDVRAPGKTRLSAGFVLAQTRDADTWYVVRRAAAAAAGDAGIHPFALDLVGDDGSSLCEAPVVLRGLSAPRASVAHCACSGVVKLGEWVLVHTPGQVGLVALAQGRADVHVRVHDALGLNGLNCIRAVTLTELLDRRERRVGVVVTTLWSDHRISAARLLDADLLVVASPAGEEADVRDVHAAPLDPHPTKKPIAIAGQCGAPRTTWVLFDDNPNARDADDKPREIQELTATADEDDDDKA